MKIAAKNAIDTHQKFRNIRRAARFALLTPSSYGRFWLDRAGEAIGADNETAATAEILTDTTARVKAAHRSIHADRSTAGHDMSDFSHVLGVWGITEGQIPLIVRNMLMEIYVWSAIGGFGAALIWYAITHPNDPYGIFSMLGGLVMGMGCVGICTCRAWRIHVLRSRRFIPFLTWLKPGAARRAEELHAAKIRAAFDREED